MTIRGIIWLRDVVDKLFSKHGVEAREVEEALNRHPKVRFVEHGERRGRCVSGVRPERCGAILGNSVCVQENTRVFDSER